MTHESEGIRRRKTLASRIPAFVIRNVSLISPQSPRFQFTILDRLAGYCAMNKIWSGYNKSDLSHPRVNDLFKLAYRTGSLGCLINDLRARPSETHPRGFFRGTHSSLFARSPACPPLGIHTVYPAQYEIQRPSVLVASSQPPRGNSIFLADDNRTFSP